jgi:hypothetical protein
MMCDEAAKSGSALPSASFFRLWRTEALQKLCLLQENIVFSPIKVKTFPTAETGSFTWRSAGD